jgi:spore photoproduct lyase
MDKIVYVDVDKLRPHPINSKIYVDPEDSILDRDIKESNIREPLIITPDYTIVSGSRRWSRAKKLGIKKVPCIVKEYQNEWEIKKALVMLNRYRVKTPREIYNEAQLLREYYKQLKGFRSMETKSTKGTISVKDMIKTKGSTREKVAKDIGVPSSKIFFLESIYSREDRYPDIVEKVDRGEITISRAYQEIKTRESGKRSDMDAIKRVQNGSKYLSWWFNPKPRWTYYIDYFDRTPDSIYCPHFWELKWSNYCPYRCAYCYLQGTYRGRSKKELLFTFRDREELSAILYSFFHEPVWNGKSWGDIIYENLGVQVFNTGELADSLCMEHTDDPFSLFIIDIFSSQPYHKVLFLTKSDNVDNLLRIEPSNKAIISFSINAIQPAKQWEIGAPDPIRRLEAARRVKEHGYETRIRYDPIFPIDNWEHHYSDIIDETYNRLSPDRITLGTPRGLKNTIRFSKDKTWTKYFTVDTEWGRKLDPSLRYEIYTLMYSKIREYDPTVPISICKEEKSLWEQLKGYSFSKKCNCVS